MTLRNARCVPIAVHSGARHGTVRAATSVSPNTASSTRYAHGSCPAGAGPTGDGSPPTSRAVPACTTVDAAGTSRNTTVVPSADTTPPNRSRNAAQACPRSVVSSGRASSSSATSALPVKNAPNAAGSSPDHRTHPAAVPAPSTKAAHDTVTASPPRKARTAAAGGPAPSRPRPAHRPADRNARTPPTASTLTNTAGSNCRAQPSAPSTRTSRSPSALPAPSATAITAPPSTARPHAPRPDTAGCAPAAALLRLFVSLSVSEALAIPLALPSQPGGVFGTYGCPRPGR
ncbi:hypothetical protein JCM4914_67790 [Streptomyces platensis subsp. malvinus]